LGVRRELQSTLAYLRKERPACRVVCGFRDILDEKSALQAEWERRGTIEALERYFDHILIYGEQRYFDFASEYDLPSPLRRKLIYTGYVIPELSEAKPLHLPFDSDAPLVTFTFGGGEDGGEILATVLDMLESEDAPSFNSFILTGPFAPGPLIRRAQALAKRSQHVMAADFTHNPLDLFRESALVVSMGGYNAMTELMAYGQNLLVIPRIRPRQEQWIRASIFKKHGFCEVIDPRLLSRDLLRQEIESALGREARSANLLPAAGLAKFQSLFMQQGPLQ